MVEHAEFAKQVAGLHQRHDTLASVDRAGHRNRDPSVNHEIQGIGWIGLLEQHVATG